MGTARKVKVKCPYCGKENEVLASSNYDDRYLCRCDFMEGGCDRDFIADVKVQFSATPLKIEGEETKEVDS